MYGAETNQTPNKISKASYALEAIRRGFETRPTPSRKTTSSAE